MVLPVKNKERRFRKGLAIYLATIALLALLDKVAEFMLGVGMYSGPYGAVNLVGYRFLAQVLLVGVGIVLFWSIIAFVTGQLKEIKDNQVEWKPRGECREYPLAGLLAPRGAPLTEVARQWNAARDYATMHPEDANHWQRRMQHIIAGYSQTLSKYFENLTSEELAKERKFAEENLAGARSVHDTEARIRWQAVVNWIDDALYLKNGNGN